MASDIDVESRALYRHLSCTGFIKLALKPSPTIVEIELVATVAGKYG